MVPFFVSLFEEKENGKDGNGSSDDNHSENSVVNREIEKRFTGGNSRKSVNAPH